MVEKFLFVFSRGLEDPVRATRGFQLAKVAKEKGHEVSIFLVDDAVVYGVLGLADNVKAPTGDDAKSYIDYLVGQKVPFYICTPCARYRMFGEDEFIEGAKLSTAGHLIDLAAEAKVFTF
ncbi:putative peroxiredoxin [Desulfosporosinus orientis DSM 765]|uniref:Putative peroxiredoxin n=1 Tax=Desulfosporosinus orientis (strain ATCC 19365 / DSM 765 / NCIMB 8382 / VKM B-1628 / Singapore I) TaxID=768706 RepID=G7WEM8_DESOD|nr:DsrE family protein [Desulfosporosinus orientis]AET66919.1 putative peroxiredoxin [Desulfosporosinus orientis DSM 765]